MVRSILIFMGLVAASSAQAVDFFRGPISSALGGGGRAGVPSSEAAFLNPALIPLVKAYEINFLYRDGYIGRGSYRGGWAAGAVDNSEDIWFPGSLHYVRTRETGRSSPPAKGEAFHGAAAYLIKPQWSVGATLYRLEHRLDRGGRSYRQWNGSVGTVYLIHEDLALAYVLDNVARPSGDVPEGLTEEMQQSVGSFYRIADIATIRVDLARRETNNPDHDLIWMTGLESATSPLFAIRLGYRNDEQFNQSYWTAGLAFTGPRLRVDYAIEKPERGTSGALHSVDMRIPF